MNLQQTYSRQNWQMWLSDIFGSQAQFETQAEIIDIDRENIKSIQRFASVKLADGKTLAVLDIETRAGVQIARNRVGLHNLVEKFIDHARYHGILAFYHNDNSEYRMSFISREPTIDAAGNFTVQGTAPKRFTYVLGENEKTKTPTDQLKTIADKRGSATLEDIKKAFSVETLTKEFYKELFDWYQWAETCVAFPGNRNIEEHLILLITRLMFVWFIKQKKLVPDTIFDTAELEKILHDFDPASETDGKYYNAILQNLFFATLNRTIEERSFTSDARFQGRNEHYGIKNLFRDNKEESWFKYDRDNVVSIFKVVPFLNGGLFECLDKEAEGTNAIQYIDGFSREKGRQKRAFVPNALFFDADKGLISILKRYNFTVEENTPTEIDVALDPELLGKVFENLLGAYNPETKETARKQSGSFYTPREIVNYMVDESLVAYLKQTVGEQYEEQYRNLFVGNTEMPDTVKSQIYNALRNCKILDPACGSGAFPMGILNRIICMMEHLGLPPHISIFDLKLHLIENCIFGVDIQSIAVQISKLRFFISLIVEQTPTNDVSNNYGIKPLPNLETKFVAANTLIGIAPKNIQGNLFEDPQIEVTKNDLLHIRRKHFSASTAQAKKTCREEDSVLRKKLASLLEANDTFAPDDAKQLAAWNPYDQNASSPFFDAEWMFGLKDGFDVVIGNPPYIQLQKNGGELSKLYGPKKEGKKIIPSPYQTFDSMGDIYSLFYERGYQLLKPQGRLCFITSNKWMRAGYGENTRKFFAENTNPEQLIDFAGVKVFEQATVDTNILMFAKDKNRQQTQACIVKKEGIKDLSVFIRQSSSICSFGSDSWVVLSPIEQGIKAKIEAVGTPLKDWDIQINYGIKTGFNDAFIISGEKRKELIEQDPKSEEIIRPLLRGRDIKRYDYEFADLHLICTFPSKRIDIEKYPAVKNHLLSFGIERLEQTGKEHIVNGEKIKARKKTGNKWFETQDQIGYWEDFYKQKIMYPDITERLSFCLVNEEIYGNNTIYFISSKSGNLEYLLKYLNSNLINWYYKTLSVQLGETAVRMFSIYVLNIPIPKNGTEDIYKSYALNEEEIKFIESISCSS